MKNKKSNKINKRKTFTRKLHDQDYELNNSFIFDEEVYLESLIPSDRKWRELIEGELLC